MGAIHSEQGICLECHSAIDFRWRDEGQKVLGVGTTHVVAVEPDGKDPLARWLTLQARCRCGATLGWLVEHRPATAGEDRSAPAPTGTGPATSEAGAAPPPRAG